MAAPIEQEINGVDNMLYVVSQSTGNGAVEINVVFKPGTNIDQAQVLVQNRVSIALPRLPEEVQRIGVTVRKSSPDLMLVIHLHLAGRQPRSAIHLQLRDHQHQGRASPASTASATPSCSARATIRCGSGSTPPRCRRAA